MLFKLVSSASPIKPLHGWSDVSLPLPRRDTPVRSPPSADLNPNTTPGERYHFFFWGEPLCVLFPWLQFSRIHRCDVYDGPGGECGDQGGGGWGGEGETLRFHVDTSQSLHCAGAIRGAQNYPIQSQRASKQPEGSGREGSIKYNFKIKAQKISKLCSHLFVSHRYIILYILVAIFNEV